MILGVSRMKRNGDGFEVRRKHITFNESTETPLDGVLCDFSYITGYACGWMCFVLSKPFTPVQVFLAEMNGPKMDCDG